MAIVRVSTEVEPGVLTRQLFIKEKIAIACDYKGGAADVKKM